MAVASRMHFLSKKSQRTGGEDTFETTRIGGYYPEESLEGTVISAESCRPRALTRRLWRIFKPALKKGRSLVETVATASTFDLKKTSVADGLSEISSGVNTP